MTDAIAIGHLSDSGDLKTQQSSLYSSTCLAKVLCLKTRTVNILVLIETKQIQHIMIYYEKGY